MDVKFKLLRFLSPKFQVPNSKFKVSNSKRDRGEGSGIWVFKQLKSTVCYNAENQ